MGASYGTGDNLDENGKAQYWDQTRESLGFKGAFLYIPIDVPYGVRIGAMPFLPTVQL